MSLIKGVLENLSVSLSEHQVSLGDMVYHPYKLLYGDLKKFNKGNSIYKAVRRSDKEGYIKKRTIDDKTYYALTELGREKLKRLRSVSYLDIESKSKDWDGKYRIVFFDIPEKNRPVRDLLRNKLKELNFVGWQKSVWVSKEDVTQELRKFFEEAGLDDYALVIETSELGHNKLEYLLLAK